MKFLFYGLSDVEKGDVCKKKLYSSSNGWIHTCTYHAPTPGTDAMHGPACPSTKSPF